MARRSAVNSERTSSGFLGIAPIFSPPNEIACKKIVNDSDWNLETGLRYVPSRSATAARAAAETSEAAAAETSETAAASAAAGQEKIKRMNLPGFVPEERRGS